MAPSRAAEANRATAKDAIEAVLGRRSRVRAKNPAAARENLQARIGARAGASNRGAPNRPATKPALENDAMIRGARRPSGSAAFKTIGVGARADNPPT